MAGFLYGFASGVGLCIGLLAILGLYVKTHQEQVMRNFIRRSMRGAMGKRNATINADSAKTSPHS